MPLPEKFDANEAKKLSAIVDYVVRNDSDLIMKRLLIRHPLDRVLDMLSKECSRIVRETISLEPSFPQWKEEKEYWEQAIVLIDSLKRNFCLTT